MKNTLLLTALSASLLFATTAQAQIPGVSKVTKALPKVDLGIKLGTSFNQATSAGFEQSYKAGIQGGAFVGVYKNKIGVQVEGLVRSSKFDASVGGLAIKTVSLDIPVLFEYKIVSRLWVQIGPQFSEMLSAKDNSSPVNDVKSSFKTADFSGVLGLQVKLPVHLIVGARYVYGFSDLNNSGTSGASWKDRSIQAYVGFRFL